MIALDAFCGQGGQSRGLADAGFEVVGVDLTPQPLYPFEFVRADVFDLSPAFLAQFDLVVASPPCQASCTLRSMPNYGRHVDLIARTRRLLTEHAQAWWIENVEGAPLREPVRLCGSMFGLAAGGFQLRRHRLFETSFPAAPPSRCAHLKGVSTLGIYGDHARTDRRSYAIGNGQLAALDGLRLAREAMAMPWADWRGLTQAIPPAYSSWLASLYLLGQAVRCQG